MNEVELEMLALLHTIKVSFGRLGDLGRLTSDDGAYTFPTTVINLTPRELVGVDIVLKVMPQVVCMAVCRSEGRTEADCQERCCQPVDASAKR